MKYTKKAYLTLTPPATQSGQGRIDDDNVKQLLETLLVRQDEENSPYTTQLVRLKKEIQDIMMDTTLSVTAKVKLLNDRISSYRSMLQRSKQHQPTTTTPVAVAPPPTPDTPSVIITPDTTTTSTPVRPRSTTRPKRLLPTTPISTASPSGIQTPRSTLRDTEEIVNINKRLLETKRKQLELMKEEQRERDLKKKRKQTPDSGLGDSPVANRVRSRTGQQQEGTGRRRRLSIPSSWRKVRFLRQ